MKRSDEKKTQKQKILSFCRGKYYFIKNLSNNLYMSANKNEHAQKDTISFGKLKNLDLNQMWMIQQVDDQVFQIIHPYSSLVLEFSENSLRLSANKLKNCQTFWIEKSFSSIEGFMTNVFVIKEFKNSKKYLYLDQKGLRCGEKPLFEDECNKWRIQIIKNHPLLIDTFLIENYNSGLVLEVYQSKQEEGQRIVQNLPNNQFNQKWQIIQTSGSFEFRSLKTGMVLGIKGERTKEGTSIIQLKSQDALHQKWILQRHGKRIYIIRSLLDKSLMLGIKGNSLKDEAQVVTTKNQLDAFWRISGDQEF